MAEATEQLRIVLTAQDNASAVVKNVGNTIQSTLSSAVSGAAAGVGFAAFNQIAQSIGQAFGFAKDAIIGFNATLEQSRIAWSTMLGGGEAAESMLKRIQTFAASTPFSFPQVEQAARRFVAMGIAAGDVIPLMRSVGAAAIAVGGGSDAVNRISLALGQMSTRTKVTAEDMMQLTEVGIPAWKILADATGQSVAQIQDSVTKGQISADVMIAAFQRFAEVNWAKLLDTQTFNTAVSNIEDNIRQLLAGAFEPLFKGLEDLAIRFEAFTKSADLQGFSQNVRNAQVAVGALVDTLARGGPIAQTLQGALAGLATVLGVQLVLAAGRAAVAMAAMVAPILIANAPMIALAAAAAVLGVAVVANFEQIRSAADEFGPAVTEKLGALAEWFGSTFAPAVASAAATAWEGFAAPAIGAFNAIVSAWNTFWGTEIGPSGETAFTQLQEMARAGWEGFAELATEGIRAVLTSWSNLIGILQDLRAAGAPVVGIWGAIADQTVDVDAATKSFSGALRQVPGIATQATTAFQAFVAELPAAIQRTVELLQATGGQLSDLGPTLLAMLQRTAADVTDGFAALGTKSGQAFGTGVVKAVKPLLEELARMLAQQQAAPVTQALEDTQAAIERDKLLLQIRGMPAEVRAQARREIRQLTRDVLPTQQLEAFDVNRTVTLAQRPEQAAILRNQILETQLALAGQQPGGAVATVTGAPPALAGGPAAPTAPPRPTTIDLRIEISTDGSAPEIYQELIEANGQAQMPPVIQVSAVRRN